MMVDNVHLEHGVVYEYVSSAGIKHHVLEKMVEPKGCFSLTAKVIIQIKYLVMRIFGIWMSSEFLRLFSLFQILEAFSKDDKHFVTSCSQLIAQSERVMSMPQYEFRNICDTKLESIRTRICSYQRVGKTHIIYSFFSFIIN